MLVIGDVHGKINEFWQLHHKLKPEKSIQLGDFGFKRQHDWFLENMDCQNHKINFGNHDYYPYLNREHSLGDWSYENGIFTIRGAYSTDRRHDPVRENFDWFANEEISYANGYKVIDAFVKHKPEIVVTHDCPQSIAIRFFQIHQPSLTRQLLQACVEMHQPLLWIFGHHHKHKDTVVVPTRFICLGELETFIF